MDGRDQHGDIDRNLTWVPEWSRQLRRKLTSAGFPMTPLWVKRGDKATFWGEVWGLRGCGPSGTNIDVFMDRLGAVWATGPIEPRYVSAKDGIVTVKSEGGRDITFPAELNAFVAESLRPVRADHAFRSRGSATLTSEIAEPVMRALNGRLAISQGMIVGVPA